MSASYILPFWSLVASVLLPASALKKGSEPGGNPVLKWTIEKTSTLRVKGSSNVNNFSCDINGYYAPDTLICVHEVSRRPVRLSGSLEIEVSRFDCHSRMITSDLRKTLKAEKYPRFLIRFLSLDAVPKVQSSGQYIKGCVEVELAGVRKVFQIDYVFTKRSPSSFLLNGIRVFCFSDFNLTPPRKLAGAVQVRDEFTVEFQLKLNAVQ